MQLDDSDFPDDLVLLSHVQQQIQIKTVRVAPASAMAKQDPQIQHRENQHNHT